MKAQDLVKKENIHHIYPFRKPRVRNPVSGPLKAKVAQPVEEILDWNKMDKDHIMNALVGLAKKR
eukprot:2371580-Prorocentrum_lima.AAC.1